ncbi:hypothetical protein PT015_16205 [Candidatus Mycobacterium wuenschmannii]|uniref:Transmembrane protein n=1 Tax=Candidatus Mycobacterium wuenschmannii TaxID=3027808 RepID=A0ABY8VTT0_9MYCO|nr:hypothetical protein [Candidatus Mycobacterium wuenschmannii]WIM86440.1 hypothetical protein PT015_16205 [Candidatus Mycobacterium wuenschmannii]
MSAPPPGYPDYRYSGYPPSGYGPPPYPSYPPMGYPPAAYSPQGYPAAAYPAQPYPPPPAYPPPSYQPISGWQPPYTPQPTYAQPPRAVWAPGIIPLRPLSLSDIFNGAAVYIRANPRATLGVTAVVVVITQLISLAAALGPLAAASKLRTEPADELTGGDIGAWSLSAGLSGVVGWLGGILLTGMLTVVVGRAVFGGSIGAGEAWARIRGRLPTLLGLVALELGGLVLLAGGVGVIIGATAAAGNVAAAVMLGFPLVLTAGAGLIYLYVALTFAPVLVVLERLPVIAAVTRSFALVRNNFWRILGIRMLTWLVVSLIAGAIAVPFNFLGQLAGGSGPLLVAATVGAVGAAIGRIVTTPFDAGVVVLLYTDRRIRSEAFDLVLQTGAARGPAGTDDLWLTRPV